MDWRAWSFAAAINPMGQAPIQAVPIIDIVKLSQFYICGDVRNAASPAAKELQVARQRFCHDEAKRLFAREMDKRVGCIEALQKIILRFHSDVAGEAVLFGDCDKLRKSCCVWVR